MTSVSITETLEGLSWKGDRFTPLSWTLDEINQSRRMIRVAVMIDRGGRGARAKSVFGASPAIHYHEIINRARTPEGSIARWLCYQPEVCSLLTVQEHDKAHNTEARNILFQHNYRIYGYDDVKTVFNLINQNLIVPLSIRLPEPE